MALMEDPEARGEDRPCDPSWIGAKAAINLTKSNTTKQELQESLQKKIAESISPTWKAWLRDFDNETIQDEESQHALAANNHDAIQSMVSPPSPSALRTMTPTSQNDIEHDYQAPDDMHMPATTEDVDLQTQLAQASAVLTSTYNGLDGSAGEKRKEEPIRAQEKSRKHIRNGDDYTGSHANYLPSPAISNPALSGAHRELDSMQQLPAPLSILERETNYRTPSSLPAWLLAISPTSLEMKMLDKKRPQSLTALLALKGCITRCAAESSELTRWRLFDELRDHIHKAEIKLDVNKFIVKKSNVLTPQNGLPQILREDADYPTDLKADSFQLYTRWYQGIFVQDILRGIDLIKGKDRNGDRLNPDYRKEHPSDARVYGYNGLVLGQWWPTQLCTVRDGAHGAAQGGIFGAKDKGAFSVVVSGGGGYHDEDHGDEIFYSGTNGKGETPTENTLHMIKSIELQNPIRVIRSHMLGKSNRFRPEVGFRFDGLYVVKSKQLVDKEKAAYHFHLVRCEGQQPIRCGSNAASRPTVFEVEEYQRLKAEKKWM